MPKQATRTITVERRIDANPAPRGARKPAHDASKANAVVLLAPCGGRLGGRSGQPRIATVDIIRPFPAPTAPANSPSTSPTPAEHLASKRHTSRSRLWVTRDPHRRFNLRADLQSFCPSEAGTAGLTRTAGGSRKIDPKRHTPLGGHTQPRRPSQTYPSPPPPQNQTLYHRHSSPPACLRALAIFLGAQAGGGLARRLRRGNAILDSAR